MKIAVSCCNGRIAPVFDVSENILLISPDGSRATASIPRADVRKRAEALGGLGVSVLICGAVSIEQETALAEAGLDARAFVCGEVEAIVRAFQDGRLGEGDFMMPGCCDRRRLRRRGCRQGAGWKNNQTRRN